MPRTRGVVGLSPVWSGSVCRFMTSLSSRNVRNVSSASRSMRIWSGAPSTSRVVGPSSRSSVNRSSTSRAKMITSVPRLAVSFSLMMAVVASCAFYFARPATALAWNIGKSSNGVIIDRESSDSPTQTVSVYVYYDYKGGDEAWVSTLSVNTGSFNQNKLVANFGSTEGGEIALIPGYKLQYVHLSGPNRGFGVISEPLDVSVRSSVALNVTGTVSVGNSPTSTIISSMPTQVVSAVVSTDTTLPVSVSSVAGLDPDVLGFGTGLGLVCLGIWSAREFVTGGVS